MPPLTDRCHGHDGRPLASDLKPEARARRGGRGPAAIMIMPAAECALSADIGQLDLARASTYHAQATVPASSSRAPGLLTQKYY